MSLLIYCILWVVPLILPVIFIVFNCFLVWYCEVLFHQTCSLSCRSLPPLPNRLAVGQMTWRDWYASVAGVVMHHVSVTIPVGRVLPLLSHPLVEDRLSVLS